MRVAKTKSEIEELQKNGVKDTSGFVELSPKVSKDSQSTGDPHQHPNFWAGYDFQVGSLDFHDKQRYEWFCAGFLLYYDAVVRNGAAAADHLLWFKWHKNHVDIYINPGPDEGKKNKFINANSFATSDPPKPPPPPPPPIK